MVVENPTTYDESDANARFALDATSVTVTALDQTDDAHYVADDKGAGHFDDFEHLVDIECTDVGGAQWTWRKFIFYALWAATEDDLAACVAASDDGITAYFFTRNFGDPLTLTLDVYNNGGSEGTDTYAAALDTPYYLTIEKSGTTVTCKIYSDAIRATLLDTLTVGSVTDNTYRYVYFVQSEHGGGGNTPVSGVIDDLDLQEGGAGVPIGAISMHQLGHIISKIVRG